MRTVRMKLFAWVGAVLALILAGTPAYAGKGLGPLYNTRYESSGVVDTHASADGRVAVVVENIETVNCGGCDTVWYGPGTIFHLRNLSQAPVCASFAFTKLSDDYSIDQWGSGDAYYLKRGKQVSKVGGLYVISTGGTGSVDLNYTYTIRTWEPLANKTCGAAPSV